MEKEILEMIKKEVSDMEKIAVRDYSEIEKLEKDPNVQRYIYLKGLKENRDLIEYGARGIIYDIIEKYGHGLIKESNNIWCFLFESEVKDVKGIPISYLNDFDDDEKMLKIKDHN